MTTTDTFSLVHLKNSLLFFLFMSALVFSAIQAHAETSKLTGKTLLIYYSWSGNTERIAAQVKNALDVDVIKLETVDAYPKEYRPTTIQAKKELQEGYRPALSTSIPNLDEYDTIILGSPLWWGTVAMPMLTLLDSVDLSGKNVALFVTHGGSQLGHSVEDIKKVAPQANVLEALAISAGSVRNAHDTVRTWLQNIGFTVKPE